MHCATPCADNHIKRVHGTDQVVQHLFGSIRPLRNRARLSLAAALTFLLLILSCKKAQICSIILASVVLAGQLSLSKKPGTLALNHF